MKLYLKVPVALLIGVNTIRILGVVFLVLHAAGRLPGPFAPVAGWGDIFVGLAAGPLAWWAHKKPLPARPAVWAWNVFGLVDLVAAVSLGATSAPGPLRLIFAEPGTAMMSTLPWLLIPGFLVPLLACTHLAIFYRLVREQIRATAASSELAQFPCMKRLIHSVFLQSEGGAWRSTKGTHAKKIRPWHKS